MMSRMKHLATNMFRTLTVPNVCPTRKSTTSRLTRLRLLHYPKTYGMSCASSVEIEDVSHKAPCHLHVPNSYGTECARKSKFSRLTRLRLLHYPKTYGMSCASSIEIEDVSHKAPCRIHVPNSYGTECAAYEKV